MRLLSVLYLVFHSTILLSQIGFNRTYDQNGGAEVGKVILANDSSFLVAASILDSSFSVSILLERMDLFGGVLKSMVLRKDSHDLRLLGLKSLIQTQDGNYLISGGIENRATSTRRGLLIKFSQELDTIWLKTYQLGSHMVEFGPILELPNGDIVTTGYYVSSINTNPEILFSKFSSTGEIKWFQTLGTSNSEVGFSLSPTFDGGFYIGAQVERTSSFDKDPYLLKIDSTGAVEWDTIFGGSMADGPAIVTTTLTGKSLVATHFADSTSGNITFYGKPWILEFNELGEVVWQKKYGRNLRGEPSAIQQHLDSTISIVGNYQDGNPSESIVGWVAKTTQNGEMLWEVQFVPNPGSADNGNSYLRGLALISNKSIAVCGFTQPSTGQDLWVAKLDSNGCYDPNRNCWVSTEEYTEIPEGTFKMWPNPAKDRVWISLPEQPMAGTLRFFSITGQQLREESISKSDPREVGLTIQDWAPGMYLVRWEPLEGPTMEGKILVETR